MQDVQLGRYRLLKLLATGGMGEVFLARQEGPAGFAKTMVVKRMLAHLGMDPKFVEMFLNEARLAARLSHPNIVQIFELGEQDGAYFMAMEFVHGVDLRSIRRHMEERHVEVPADLAAWICAQALKGLHYAHTLTDENGAPLNIVHRDVSPDNVLVDFNASVKMVDFGIAKASNFISTTGAGAVKGKFAYMAPELLSGQPATPRTDIYAMGIVLYELLSGGRPFQGTSEGALIKSILVDAPRPLRDLRPGIPPELGEIIHRAISRNPQERFRTAENMSAALEGFALASGGMAQEGVKELLRGLFGDELEIISPVTPTPRPGPASTPPRPLAAESRASSSSKGPSHSSGPRAEASGTPSSLSSASQSPPSAPPSRVAVPLRWKGIAAAITVAAAGLMLLTLRLPPEPKTQTSSQALPRAQQLPEEAPASAVAPATEPPVPAEPPPPPAVAPSTEPAAATAPEPPPSHAAAAPKAQRAARAASKGTVVLRVSPGAEVIYEGRTLGVTPMAPIKLPSGARTLTLVNRNLGVEKKIRVIVPVRRKVVVRVNLTDKT